MVLILKRSLVTTFLLAMIIYCAAFVPTKSSASSEQQKNMNFGKTLGNNEDNMAFINNKRYQRSVYGLGQKMLSLPRSKIPVELELLVDELDDNSDERPKRYDDYGHMRFGKRGGGKFDDYGHMRFGRSI